MSYSYPMRRRRRRRGLWVLAVLIVIGSVIALAVYLRGERRDLAAYFEVARDVVEDERVIAADLEDVLRSMEEMERQDLFARIGDLAVDTSAAYDALVAGDLPPPAAVPHGFLVTAAAAWRDGVGALDDAIVAVLADPTDPTAAALLEEAFANLRVGDRAYAGFIRAVGDLDPDIAPRSYPEVAFVAEAASLYDVALTVDRLQRLQQLTVRHDVAVTLTLDPIPAGDRNGILIIPYAGSLDAQVVVSNVGNEPEQGIVVELELVTIGEVDVYGVTRTVGSLAAGTHTTVSFDDLPAVPGGLQDLVIRVEIEDDADQENNSVRLLFQMNEPA